MFNNPLVLFGWLLAPAAVVFGLSFLPERFKLTTPLANEQPWDCRAVSLALAVSLSAPLLWLLMRITPLRDVRGGLPWVFEGLWLLQQLIAVAPVLLVLRLHKRPFRHTLGFTRRQAVSLSASAATCYFLLVFIKSALRHYYGKGWDTLYTNYLFGDRLFSLPLQHALALVTISAIGACVEEIILRGFALIPLVRVIGPAGGIALTALSWSMGHIGNIATSVSVFLMGLCLGWVFYRTGSLVPSMTFHVLWNLGMMSDFVFGRLRAAGIHWTSAQHFRYIGGGSLAVALACGLLALASRKVGTTDH